MANEQEIGKLVISLIAEVKDLKKGLGEAKKNIDDFTNQGKKSGKDFEDSLGGIKAGYLKIAAAAYTAYRLIMQAMDWAKIGAQAQAVEKSFEMVSKSFGVDGRTLIDEMKKVSGVWVESTSVMVKAQRLLAEGLSAKDLIDLTKASRVAAKMMGVEVSEAFERVSEAVITLRTRGLKAAFPMDVADVTEKYARSLGTVSKYLSESGQRQAIVNEIVRQSIEKQKLLGSTLDPDNYDKVQRFNSAIAQLKEEVGKLIADAIIPLIDSLITVTQNLDTATPGIIKYAREWFLLATPTGGLGQAYILFKKISEIIGKFKTPEVPPETRFTKTYIAQQESLARQEILDEEERKKRGKNRDIDERKRIEDLTKFRLANEEQRVTSQANIEKMGLQIRRTQEITALKKLGEDTIMEELGWDRKIAQVDYETTMKSIDVRRRAEIEAATISGMDIADVKKKFRVFEKEAAEKLAAELGEIEAKKALSFEELTGLTEQEIRKRTEYSRAMKEGEIDDWKRANKVQEALEAKLSDQIVKNKMEEDQLSITKEDRLRKEIDLSTELLGYAQERLNVLSEEDDAWVSASGQVEGYVNRIKELNYELDRQTATFEQLAVSGLKKYSIALKEDLIDNMENFVPRAIDSAGGAFKTFLKDVSSGTKSLSESFKDMAKSFGESIMDMIIDIGLLIIKMELLKALKIDQPTAGAGAGAGGGGYGWIGSILSLIVGLFQAGGTIRGPSGRDKVLIGATAGEFMQPVPTVKYYGEDVMEKLRRREIPREALLSLSSGIPQGSRVRPSFMMEAGGTVPTLSGGRGEEKKTEITLINVIDQREMDSWAASARGQNAIINVISSRAETVRKVLQ